MPTTRITQRANKTGEGQQRAELGNRTANRDEWLICNNYLRISRVTGQNQVDPRIYLKIEKNSPFCANKVK